MAKKISPTFSSGGFPVVPFTPTGIDTGFQGSKYERPIAPGESVENVLAAEQGMLDATGNILGRFLGRATLSAAETVGMLGYGSIAAIRDGKFSSFYDNELSKEFKKANDALINNTPFYDSEAERKAKFFSSDIGTVLSSAGFWGNALGEGGGFVAGAMLGGMGTGAILKGLGSAVKGLNTLTRTSRAVTAATKAEQVAALAAETKNPVNFANKVKDFITSNKFRNAAEFQTQRAVSNMYEAGVEAKQIKEEYVANMEKDYKLQYGEEAIPDETIRTQWEAEANKYANVAFGINMALLNIDGIGYSRYFRGYKETRKAIDATRDAATGMYKPLTGIRKGISTVKNYGGNAFAESFQEAGQFLTEKTLTDRELQSSERGFQDYLYATVKGLEETFGSKEGQESMVIGAMLGAPSGIAEGISQGKLNKMGIDLLNKYMAKESIAPIVQHTNEAILTNKGDLSERVAESSSKYLFRSAQDEAFYNFVNSRIQSGRFGDLMDDLNDFKGMNEGTFNELFATSYDKVKKDQVVNELINSAKRIQDITDKTDAVYGKNKFRAEIIKTVADVSTYDKRIRELQTKLTSENNPLERELLMSDLGFLTKDREQANQKLRMFTSLAATEESLSDKKKNEETKKEINKAEENKPVVEATPNATNDVTKKGSEVIVDGKKVIVEGELEDGTIRGATSAGPIVFDPDERDAGAQGIEKTEYYDEEPQELDTEKVSLGRDALDRPSSGEFRGQSFVYDLNDPNSEFGNWNDFQPKLNSEFYDYKVEKGKKVEPLEKENADKSREITDWLIDNQKKIGETHRFEVRDENGRKNLYAIDRATDKATHIGYFLNGNTKPGNSKNEKSKVKHENLNEFVDSYSQTPQGQRKQVPNKEGRNVFMDVINGWRKLISNKVTDITKHLRMRSEIINGTEAVSLGEILNSKYAERWKVNGEYVIVQNDNGNYNLIDTFSKNATPEDRKKLIDLTSTILNREGVARSLGTQYAILVKRPDSDNYQFIGLKGADLPTNEKQQYIEQVTKINANPQSFERTQVADLVNTLNKNVFLATNKTVKVNGEDIPIHIRFYHTKTNKIAVIAAPKLGLDGKPVGVKFDVKTAFGTFTSPENAISTLAKRKVYKTSEEAQDLDFLKDYLQTKVSPQIWKTYLRFEHRNFLDENTNQVSEKYTAGDQEFPANSENTYNVGDAVIWNGAPHTIAKIVPGGVPFYTLADANGNIVKTFTKQERLFPANNLTPAKTKRMKNVGMDRQQAEDDIERRRKEELNKEGVSEEILSKQPFITEKEQILRNEINAKYDAELAVLRAQPEVIQPTETYKGIEIINSSSITTATGEPGAAQYNRSQNKILINREILKKKFAEKAWIKPRKLKDGSYAQALPENSFPTYESFEKFVIEHEFQHSLLSFEDSGANTRGEYENIINYRALKEGNFTSAFSSLSNTQKETYIINKINSFKGHPLDTSYNFTEEERKYYNENKGAIDDAVMLSQMSSATAEDFGYTGTNEDVDPVLDDFDIPDGTTIDASQNKPTFKPATIGGVAVEEISDEVAKEIEAFTGLKVEFYKEGNTQNFGEFKDGIIYLNRFMPKGTQWHEAFHGIFSLLPQAEQDRLLRIAGNKWGVTNEEFMELINVYEERGHANFLKTVGKDWIVKTILEEKIADHFQEFMVEGKKPEILGSFFTKAKSFVNLMLGVVEEPSFQTFFNEVTKGNFKKDTLVGSQARVVTSKYKVIPGSSTASESAQLVRELVHMYSDRHNPELLENFPELQDASNTLQGFVRYYINILRKYANQGVVLQATQLREKLNDPTLQDNEREIIQLQYNSFRDTIQRTFVKENGLVFPAIFASPNFKMITEEVIRVGNFKEVYEETDPENEKDIMHNETVQSRNPLTETANKDLLKMLSGLYYFDMERPKFLDEKGIINNLLFNLSEVDPSSYEGVLSKLARVNDNSVYKSDFARSMEQVLNMYTTNETFRNIFNTAFDKRFTFSYQIVDTINTRTKGAKVITVNKKDHISNQMNLWKNQGFNKQIDQSIDKYTDIGRALGINIEEDVYNDPAAQPVLEKLYNIVKGRLENKDFNKVFSSEKNKAILEELATINLQKRLDIGELTYKNADDRTQYSIISNSFLLEKISKIYLPELDKRSDKKKAEEGIKPNIKYGTFSGSSFGDNSYTYKDLDPLTYLYTTFNLYNNYYMGANEVKEFTPFFFIQQFESKSTNFIFQGHNHAGNPISETLKYLNEEVDRQAIRINETLEALNNYQDFELIDGYHTIKDPDKLLSPRDYTKALVERFMNGTKEDNITRDMLPRGFQYTNLPYANEKTVSENPVTESDFERMLLQQTQNMNEYFREFNVDKMKFLSEITNNDKLTENEANKFLRDFLINQYMNRSRILSQISPNLAQFKGYVDITKRGAGILASGPNHGEGSFKFGVIKDIEINGANSTDAAGYESISERINRYIRQGVVSTTDMSNGGVSDKKYENYLLLKAHLEDDRDYIDTHQDDDALLKIDKTVGYGEEYYIKTAVAPITRYMSSQVANKEDKITVNGVEYTAVQDTVNDKYYLPLPSTVESWKMLNEMQKNNIQALFAESAIKKNVSNKVDVRAEDFAGKALTFDYKDYRLQQENPSGKEKIKDGTQLLQLIDAYFSKDFNKDITKTMDNLVSEIKEYNYQFFGKELVADINGMTYDAFIEYVKVAMQGSALSDRVTEFFEVDPVTGTMKFSSNLPMIKNKFEQYVMSYYNNNIASHKVPGNKCTLLTSLTKGVIMFGEEPISTYEYNKLSKQDKEKCSTRRLAWPTESKPYAEVIVSEEYINQMGFSLEEWNNLKKEDPTLFEKLSTAVAYRIPTQAQHSMIAIKIVDVLPASYGSTIIAPAEITSISGADYDVDSLYIHKPSVYRTMDNGKKTFKLFGDDAYSYEKSITTNKIVKEIASKLNIEEKELISAQIVNLKKSKYKLSTRLSEMRGMEAEIKNASPAERDKYYAEKDSNITEIKAINNDIQYQKDLLQEVNQRSAHQAIALIRDKDEPGKRAILAGYIQNLQNPDGTKSINSIIPESNYNKLLDIRMQVLTSPEGVRLINTPAKDFMKEIYSDKEGGKGFFLEAGYPDPNKEAKKYAVYSGQDTMLNEYRKISTGSKAIGGAANINKVAAFLQKNGVTLDSGLVERLKQLYANLSYDTSSEFESDFDFVMEDGKIGFRTKTENVLKFNTLSNMVSITVDNAKDQTLVLFNITDKNISEISTMAMLGMGLNRISAILQTPAARKISSLLSISEKGVYEYQEFKDNPKVIQAFIEDMEKKGAQQVTVTDEMLVDSISTWDENKRIEELMYSKDYNSLSEEDKNKLNTQYSIAKLYLEVSKITKDAYQINTLLNFNKGIGKDGYDISKILTANENMKLDTFSFNSHNISSNRFIDTVVNISGKLNDKIGNKIIAYHENTDSLTSSILRSTDKEGNDFLSKKFQTSLNKSFIEFLAINMFFSKHRERNILGGIDLYDPNVVNGTAITEAYNKVKNKLDAFAIGKMFEEKKITRKYPFPRVGIDTFNNLSAAEEQSIVDSFDMMVMSTDADIKNFAYQVLAHVATHDNYRYLQGSVVSKLRAQYFGTYNEMYTQYLEPIIREVSGSELSKQEKNDLQYLVRVGAIASEPKTVRQKLVYHTKYPNYTTLIGNFAKYFFSDNRNARHLKFLKDTKFIFKPQEGESIEIIPQKTVIEGKDYYMIETDPSINSYDVMSPLAFNDGKGIYIKERYQNNVPSSFKEGVTVNKIVYKKLEVINKGYLPSVLMQQYPYEQYKEIVEEAIKKATDRKDFGGASYGEIDNEEPEWRKSIYDSEPIPYNIFPDEDPSTNEVEKENNSLSNPTVQQNTSPVVPAEETFSNPDNTADALLKANEDKQKDNDLEEMKKIAGGFDFSNYPKMKPIPQNTLTNEVIDEISNNFEQYRGALENIGINSVEQLMELPDEKKETLIQDICKG